MSQPETDSWDDRLAELYDIFAEKYPQLKEEDIEAMAESQLQDEMDAAEARADAAQE